MSTGSSDEKLCEDCPPVGYPTDKTRCEPCPRRQIATPGATQKSEDSATDESSRPRGLLTSKYLGIYSDLIKLAAQMAMGEGVPDWSERVFSTGTPSYERRDMLSALRAADEAGITHALQLRAIADRLSAEIRSSNETFDAAAELAFYRASMPESLRWDQVDSNVKDAWRKNTQKASEGQS